MIFGAGIVREADAPTENQPPEMTDASAMSNTAPARVIVDHRTDVRRIARSPFRSMQKSPSNSTAKQWI
jgi:hypothetical protein